MLLHKCFRAAQNCSPYFNGIKLVRKDAFTSQRYLGITTTLFCDKLGTDKNSIKTLKSSAPDVKEYGVPTLLSGKYDIFSEENATVILDVEEERRKYLDTSAALPTETDHDSWEEFQEVDLKRGVRGVFDVEQIVDLLRSDGAIDVFVAHLPEELRYADHLVIVTGRSGRHRKALAQLVRRVFKKKRLSSDSIPRIEGDHVGGSNVDWIAMDLGNIVLHIFARAAREKYDLESLWTLGSELDLQCAKPDDPLIELLNSHSVYLGDLEPAEPSLKSSGTKAHAKDTRN